MKGPASTVERSEESVQVTRKRFARRRLVRRLLALRWVFVFAGVLLAGGGLVWLFFFSSKLTFSHVRVTGLEVVSDRRVDELAGVQLGDPLARVDTDAIRARIEDLAAVQRAEVSRCWPHTVCVDVTEREAVAVVTREGKLWALDPHGILFRQYADKPADLPSVHVKATTSTDALAEAATVVSALPPSLMQRIDHLEVETVDEISLQLRGGAIVVWGSAEDSANKARVLAPLLAAQPRAAHYDVSVPGKPTVRLR